MHASISVLVKKKILEKQKANIISSGELKLYLGGQIYTEAIENNVKTGKHVTLISRSRRKM